MSLDSIPHHHHPRPRRCALGGWTFFKTFTVTINFAQKAPPLLHPITPSHGGWRSRASAYYSFLFFFLSLFRPSNRIPMRILSHHFACHVVAGRTRFLVTADIYKTTGEKFPLDRGINQLFGCLNIHQLSDAHYAMIRSDTNLNMKA